MNNTCDNCGQAVRFIRRSGHKALIVNVNSVYFIPDSSENSVTFITGNGQFRKGVRSTDGLKGFVLHEC